MEILLILLPALGALFLFLSGAFSEDDDNEGGTFLFALCGLIMFVMAGFEISDAAGEKTLTKYINGEVTYDTVAIDKDGKLLEIEIKDN